MEEAIKEITSKCDVSQLATIGTTSFGEMFVLLDKDRKVLCHSISYNDSRGEEEDRKLEAELGNDRIYEITGATINGMYSLPKLLWIEENCPKIYEKALQHVGEHLRIWKDRQYSLHRMRLIL